MSLFSAIDRAAQLPMDAVYGDPIRLTPRRRKRDVNDGWEADPDRSVAELTGIYTHLAADSDVPNSKDRYADHMPGTNQARHAIDVSDPKGAAIKTGDLVEVLAGEGAGTWQVTASSPNDVGGVIVAINRIA
jgi:hypothetical protein